MAKISELLLHVKSLDLSPKKARGKGTKGLPQEWINPKYADLVKSFDDSGLPFKDLNNMAEVDCTNCGGYGRIIYTDADGSMKDIPCGRCSGSGKVQG